MKTPQAACSLETKFQTLFREESLFRSLIQARKKFGSNTLIISDAEANSLSYEELISRSYALGQKIKHLTTPHEHVGLLLPNSLAAVVSFFALQAYARIPTLLNFSAGSHAVLSACQTTQLRVIYSSKRFIENAQLQEFVSTLTEHGLKVIYLEDVAQNIHLFNKLFAKFNSKMARFFHLRTENPHNEAVTLFTSGTEGFPKGVALSHRNIQANCAQTKAVVDLEPDDVLLNVLPLFHSIGLTALLLGVFSGIKSVLYPSPLHYQKIPALIHQNKATIFFATDTFLQGYAHYAKPLELSSLRLVFAGAEKLKATTRQTWQEKFGIQILEGYGTTETSPILSLNTPGAHKAGTVGRLLPAMKYELIPIEGVNGGRLKITGPNVMLGYYHLSNPAQLALAGQQHDTGDVVHIDHEGFIRITGRAKRFAKIAGEMISLQAIEEFISELWPLAHHAVLSTSHAKHGEALILVSDHQAANRETMVAFARAQGITELMCPKKIIILEELPLLATGKVDYSALGKLALETGAN